MWKLKELKKKSNEVTKCAKIKMEKKNHYMHSSENEIVDMEVFLKNSF